jgi:hypothetical protein
MEEYRLRVFENRVLKKIFGLRGMRCQGSGEDYINRELYDMYCSPNNIWVIKSRRMRWVGHVASMGQRRGAWRVLVGDLREGEHLEDLHLDGRIILKLVFKQEVGWEGMDLIDLVKDRNR